MKAFICSVFGHKYRLLRKITPMIREVKCKRCKKEFGMNDYLEVILEMDDELRKLHCMYKTEKL
jgi:hypothetical protein